MTDVNTTELAAVAAAANPAPLSIKDTVLAQFKEAEVVQQALADKYRDCVYAVATTKGMQEAIAARADLRDNGRLALTKTETRVKKEVNDLKRLMGEEVERLVAITKPVEDSIDAQIKAEEERKAAAKAERERIERERVEKHEAGIAKLRGYGERCRGKSIEDLEQALAVLRPLPFSEEEWQEFAPKAAEALTTSIAQIEAELDVAQQRKRDEEHRLANERFAAQLLAQKAELDRQAAELMRQRVAATVFTFPEAAPANPEEAPESEPDVAKFVSLVSANNAAKAEIAAQAAIADATATGLGVMAMSAESVPRINPADVNAEPAPQTMKLGDINAKLAPLSISAAGLAEIGFHPASTEKGAKLYKTSDLPRIYQVLGNRIAAALAELAQPA